MKLSQSYPKDENCIPVLLNKSLYNYINIVILIHLKAINFYSDLTINNSSLIICKYLTYVIFDWLITEEDTSKGRVSPRYTATGSHFMGYMRKFWPSIRACIPHIKVDIMPHLTCVLMLIDILMLYIRLQLSWSISLSSR